MHAQGDRELASAQRLFEKWRRSRTRGERIPERLWSRAVRLAEQRGVSPTAIALGLDYYSLQGRLPGTSTSNGFLELSGAQLGVSRESSLSAPGVVIEIRRQDGVELSLKLPGSTEVDLRPLVERVLGARR